MFALCPPHFQEVRQGSVVVYLKVYGFHSFFSFVVKKNRANIFASSSNSFMCRILSSSDHCTDVWTPLQTAPHSVRETSVWIIICGLNWEKGRPLQNLKFSIQQVDLVLDLVFNVTTDSLFIFPLDTKIEA